LQQTVANWTTPPTAKKLKQPLLMKVRLAATNEMTTVDNWTNPNAALKLKQPLLMKIPLAALKENLQKTVATTTAKKLKHLVQMTSIATKNALRQAA
jgi:hypothetical protein